MKRQLLLLIFVLSAFVANAQVFYRCTGDYVNVRTGPGKNYRVVIDDAYSPGDKVQLMKDIIVKSHGKARNGFVPISWMYWDGWVSAQYLKPLTHTCSRCNGKGYFNRVCRDFDGAALQHPRACSCQSCGWHGGNCHYKQHCSACDGVGYY